MSLILILSLAFSVFYFYVLWTMCYFPLWQWIKSVWRLWLFSDQEAGGITVNAEDILTLHFPQCPLEGAFTLLEDLPRCGNYCCLSGSPYRSCVTLSIACSTNPIATVWMFVLKCICWHPNPKDDGTVGDWGLWEALRSWRWSSLNEISAFFRKDFGCTGSCCCVGFFFLVVLSGGHSLVLQCLGAHCDGFFVGRAGDLEGGRLSSCDTGA